MPATPTPTSELLQRADERARIEAAIGRAIGGDGGVLLLSGPAGIGKTALLREGRELGEAAGMLALSAVGSELDRAFPFGLAHQLFEVALADADDARRAHLTSGAARHAAVIFDFDAAASTPEPGHAVLHGLYWMCANFTDERPLLLLVDDLHWGDTASLRFIEYLARRLADLPALVIATVRTGEPETDVELIERLHEAPGGEQLHPGPLDEVSAATLLERALGQPSEPTFTAAAHTATGGNPFLLRALADEALDRGLTGTAAEAARVGELGSGAAGVLRRRLRSLGPAATALTHAAAVLGPRRTPDDAIAIAGVDPALARTALDVLAAAGVLQPATLSFAHPLLRAAAEATASPSERAALHARASQHLRGAGVRPEELAVHLLHAPPGTDAELIDTLAAAARAATAEGAPEAAVPYLQRALAEQPTKPRRAELLLELGLAEQRIAAPGAEAHLDEAIATGLSPDGAAHAWAARARIEMTREPGAAMQALQTAGAQAEDPDLRLRLESQVLDTTAFVTSLTARRDELLDAGRASANPSPAMLAHLAHNAAYRGAPVGETLELVDRALADGRLVDVIGPTSTTFHLLLLTLRHAERPERVERLLALSDAAASRDGSRVGLMQNDHVRGFWHLMFGSSAAAEAHARQALAHVAGLALPLPQLSATVLLSEILLEREQSDEAARLVDTFPEGPALSDTIIGPDALAVRAVVRIDQGRRDEAERDLRRAVEQIDHRGWRAPLKTRAKLRLAILIARDHPDEAQALAQHEVDASRHAGTNGALGASLRALARIRGGDEGVALLREADTVLAASPLLLERGWALHDLGRTLRIAGAKVEARDPLRQALDIAERAEAPTLRRLTQDELAASGARPRRSALSGVESLTPSERRVADLAAAGHSNREIAEALWVTRKTVEVHLGKVYGKLGIRTRGQLPAALGTSDG